MTMCGREARSGSAAEVGNLHARVGRADARVDAELLRERPDDGDKSDDDG